MCLPVIEIPQNVLKTVQCSMFTEHQNNSSMGILILAWKNFSLLTISFIFVLFNYFS